MLLDIFRFAILILDTLSPRVDPLRHADGAATPYMLLIDAISPLMPMLPIMPPARCHAIFDAF